MDFYTSFVKVFILVALLIPGFILKKLKLIDASATKSIVNILLYVCIPVLSVKAFVTTEYSSSLLINMLWMVILGFLFSILLFFAALLIFCRFKDKNKARAATAASYMSNFSFMGLPVIQALFPGVSEMIIYCSVFMAVGNILNWTLVSYTLTGEKKYISIKKAFINPPTVALAVGLPFFFFSVKVPYIITDVLELLGGITTPLAMIVVGIRFAEMNFKQLFSGKEVYISSVFKLIFAPLFCLGIMLLLRLVFPLSYELIATLYIIMAMPTANIVIMLCEFYNLPSLTAAKCVIFSSLFSILTIPLLTWLLSFI